MTEMAKKETRDPLLYSFSAYDQYACLKPSLLLIAALLFLSRSYVMPIIAAVTRFSGSTADLQNILPDANPVLGYLLGVPALALLYASIKRTPTSGRFVRWLWNNGRSLLVVITLAQSYVPIRELLLSVGPSLPSSSVADFLVVLVNAQILIFALTSRRVRDTFSQFPEPI